MEDPNTANRLTLHRLYRAPGVPQTAGLITVIGLLLIIRPELLTGAEENAATLLRVILTPLTLLNALAGTAAAIIMGLFMSIFAIGVSVNESPNRESMLTAQRILTCFVMFSNLWILAFILRDIPIPDKPAPENPRKRESDKPAKPPFT